MVLKFILIGGVLPGLLCTLTLLAAWAIARTLGSQRVPAFLFPVLVLLSILPAELLVNEKFPALSEIPKIAVDRMPQTTLVAVVIGVLTALVTGVVVRRTTPAAWRGRLVESESHVPFWLTILLAIPACAASFWIFLSYRAESFSKPGSRDLLWLAIFTFVGVLIIAVMELASRRRAKIDTVPIPTRDPAPIAVLFIAANAIPPIVVDKGNAYVAQIGGGIVAALGAALFVSFLIPRFTLVRGGITALVASLGAIGLAGYYMAEDPVPLVPMLLIAAAPLLAGAVLIFFLRAAGMWKRLIIASIVAAIPCVIAVGLVKAPKLGAAEKPESSMEDIYQQYR